ncbi:MAG: thermonuclease family protein [Candidatus Parcubacteria bacterium]|nr:thermonuclease family protein [Candidatus Parcubacteria bacterium]
MKKRLVVFFFLFGTLYGALFYDKAIPAPAQSETEQNGYVVRIVDGDTLIVQMSGIEEKIRLIGLNTPETVDPRKTVECFGKEASDEAKRILTGKSVQIETDSSQDRYDKYGRLLAYVFLSDGTNFNRQTIKNGYGYEYTYHLPYKYQKEFKQAEKYARENKKGLWADGVCGN